MRLERRTLELTAAGSAGSAVASGSIGTDGVARVHAVRIDYSGAPATTDVVLTGGTGLPILTVTDSNTDGSFYTVTGTVLADKTDSILTEVPPIASPKIDVDVAGSDPDAVITVELFLEIG